jgi:hypothetical protein
MHNAEPTKNTISRHANDLYAGGRTLRGLSVSAATIDMYSGPVMLWEVRFLTKTVSRQDRIYVPEAGLVQTREDAQESPGVTRPQMLNKGARIVPVAESIVVVYRITADHSDEGEEEQSEHEQDFED